MLLRWIRCDYTCSVLLLGHHCLHPNPEKNSSCHFMMHMPAAKPNSPCSPCTQAALRVAWQEKGQAAAAHAARLPGVLVLLVRHGLGPPTGYKA